MPPDLRRSSSTLKRSRSSEPEEASTYTMNKLPKLAAGDVHAARQSRRITATSSDDSAWQRFHHGDEDAAPKSQGTSGPKTKSGITPLQDRYTPEALFLMLKEYAFSGKLASVGVRGPARDASRPSSDESRSSHGLHSLNNTKIGGKQDIWTDEAEFAFLAAELYLPPATSSKVMFMQKPCGRNEIIALIISFALGRYMTRKQVSSHLQVVRQRKRMNLEVKCLFDQSASERSGGGSSPETGTPKLRGIHPRLFEIIGIHPQSNLSEMPKPDWILQHENGQSPQASIPQGLGRKIKSDLVDHSRARQPDHYQSAREDRACVPRYLPKSSNQPVKVYPDFHRPHIRTLQPEDEGNFYRADAQPIELDELDSDLEHDERELEQVSDSTPRASPNPTIRRLGSLMEPWVPNAPTQLKISDITLSLGARDVRISKNFLYSELPVNGFDQAPRHGWQFPVGRHGNASIIKYVHVTLCINLRDLGNTGLTGLTPIALTLDLGLQTLTNIPAGHGESLRLTTSTGFLDTPREKSHCVGLETLDVSNDPERKTLRPVQLYKDDTLPYLVKKSRDPATTLLPYYWILQEAASTRSIIKVLYTFEAAQQWSIRASEIVP